jgi:hypothetical protein
MIARKKHPEAFMGILCLLTGGADIEQVLKEKISFILHCMSSDLKAMQGRSPA